MVSRKLKAIFAISIPIFMAHGLEELWTDFYSVDPHYRWLFSPFEGMPVYKATFVLFNLMVWLWMVTSLLLICGAEWQLRLAVLPPLLYVFELHHLLDIAAARGYTPGSVTGLAFPFLTFFYGRQWLRDLTDPGGSDAGSASAE